MCVCVCGYINFRERNKKVVVNREKIFENKKCKNAKNPTTTIYYYHEYCMRT